MNSTGPASYRSEVIGSLLRPAYLKQAIAQREAGALSDEELTAAQDRAVQEAVALQESCGIDVITDGEMRRLGGYVETLFGNVQGISTVPATARRLGPPHYDMDPRRRVEGQVSAPNGLGLAADFAYLRSRTGRAAKVTCPGPLTFAGFCELAPPYRDVWELAHDVAAIINAELKECVAAGADFVQVDDPSLGIIPGEGRGIVDLVNQVVDGVEAKTALHICFGSNRGRPRGFNRT
jgi:5-methyltetrahydropteroyltriglutamate--homocysteine methyltransferase